MTPRPSRVSTSGIDSVSLARELMGLRSDGPTFMCPECRMTREVDEALPAKTFIATEVLGLDLDRAASLIASELSPREGTSLSASLASMDSELHRAIGLAQLAIANVPRRHICTLSRAEALIALPADGGARRSS